MLAPTRYKHRSACNLLFNRNAESLCLHEKAEPFFSISVNELSWRSTIRQMQPFENGPRRS